MALPIFEMIIDPSVTSDVEVSFMALVDKPAIEKNFLAFKDLQLNFATDTTKHIVSGPAMVPDVPIYRRDEMGEYNVFFSKDTIAQIALKFFKKDYHKNLNLFHDPALTLDNVTIFESFQSDASRGVQPMKGYEDLPDGTWFISAKIEDPKIWEMVTTGKIKGFSVEGIFSYVKKQKQSAEDVENLIASILNRSEYTNGHLNKTDIMNAVQSAIATFKQKFFDPPAPVAPPAVTPPAPNATLAKDYTLADGVTIINISDLKEGGTVMNGAAPAAPGEYELSDGTKITVGDGGLITAVQMVAAADPAAQYKEQFDTINTKLTSYEAKFTQYERNQLEFTSALKKTNETILGLVGIVEKMAAQPTAAPAATPSNFTGVDKPETEEERIKRLAESFKKLKTA